MVNPVKQRLYRLTLPDAILNPPVSWRGRGLLRQSLEQQFTEYVYPMPGYSEVKMFYRYGGSFIGTMADTNKWVRMYQSPKLEFVVNQDCWWSGETNFADIILPACTNLERDDIGEWGRPGGYTQHASSGCNYRVIVRQQKCIEPLCESKSDYEIFSQLADRLGLEEEFTEGKTEMDWVKALFRDLRSAQIHQLGGVQAQRLFSGAPSRRITNRPLPCAGSTKAGTATRPISATPRGSRPRARSLAPIAARSSSCRRAC